MVYQTSEVQTGVSGESDKDALYCVSSMNNICRMYKTAQVIILKNPIDSFSQPLPLIQQLTTMCNFTRESG